MTVLSLDDAKAHLNITNTDYDDELESFIEAAEAIIAKRVGPLEPTVVTSTVNSGCEYLALPVVPVISLTSVTGYTGSAVDVSGLTTDGAAGVITYTYRGHRFLHGRFTVAYVAGRAECPADLLLAVKEMVRHLWKSQRGGASRPGSSDQTPAPGYLIPNTVAELLEPHMQLGFA